MFVPIGRPDAANLGIVSFSVRRNEERENQLQAFGSIENFGDEAVTVPVDLLLDGNPIDASQVNAKPGETAGVSFNLGDVDSGVLELRLSREDALLADNRAWAAVNSSHRPKVLLVTAGNEALELALSTPRAGELAEVSKAAPDVLKTKDHQKAAASGAFDLIIYDRCQPVELPRANTLFIGQVPPAPSESDQLLPKPSPSGRGQGEGAEQRDNSQGEGVNASPNPKWWSLGEPLVFPQIIDLDKTHPLMQWLDLGDVDIAEARTVSPPPGGTRLIDSNKGTLFAIASREGFEDAVLGFEIYSVDKNGDRGPNTNWPIRRSFPAFVYAVLGYLGGGGGGQAGETVKPGQPVAIKSDAQSDQLTVQNPAGTKLSATRGKDGSFHFSDTEELGPYEVLDGAKTVERFTVNLFDELESNIPPAKEGSIQIGNSKIEDSHLLEPVRRETWKWMLLAALAVLLLEWYIYNRRIYV